MKLLFVDHKCHKVTGSAEFFMPIVESCFSVKRHYYSQCYSTGAQKEVSGNEIVVFWEFLMSRWMLYFRGIRNVFIPMYDNEWACVWQWRRIAWSGMAVVSFCGAVSDHARRCGVKNILDVKYFPDPCLLPQEEGDPKRVFLWERGEISLAIAKKLFPPQNGYVIDVKGANEYTDRNAYLQRVAKCGIVIAPRRREGIGMVFLEAMAMGKCVVAHNDATMNEYIKNGESGILFDADAPVPVSESLVSSVRSNVRQQVAELRTAWLQDEKRIQDFIKGQLPNCPSIKNRCKIMMSFPLFLLEGACHVFADMCRNRWRKAGH